MHIHFPYEIQSFDIYVSINVLNKGKNKIKNWYYMQEIKYTITALFIPLSVDKFQIW